MSGDLVQLSPSVELGAVASALDTSTTFITRILRTIVWFRLTQPVIEFLKQEEARVARVRDRGGR